MILYTYIHMHTHAQTLCTHAQTCTHCARWVWIFRTLSQSWYLKECLFRKYCGVGDVGKIWGLEFCEVGGPRSVVEFVQTLIEGITILYVTLENSCNKYHKKPVFMKNNLIWVTDQIFMTSPPVLNGYSLRIAGGWKV